MQKSYWTNWNKTIFMFLESLKSKFSKQDTPGCLRIFFIAGELCRMVHFFSCMHFFQRTSKIFVSKITCTSSLATIFQNKKVTWPKKWEKNILTCEMFCTFLSTLKKITCLFSLKVVISHCGHWEILSFEKKQKVKIG